MVIKKISEKDKVVSIWSGGTTSQLYISPENASFSDRKFDFRISSAVVELEESDFTSMPSFSRILMVLEGQLEISHEGHYSKVLKQFEMDEFSGDWKTSSKGKVVDFNLIMGEGICGSLKYISLGKGKNLFKIDSGGDRSRPVCTVGYYLIFGGIQIHLNQEEYELEKGEMILIESNFELDKIGVVGIGELIEILIW
jgi:environmental stress-induced protein Ves